MADEIPNVPGGPHLRTVAMSWDTNASGAIFGGWTVSQMDLAGGTFVAQRAPGRFVTLSIDAMCFLSRSRLVTRQLFTALSRKTGSLPKQ